MTANGFVIVGRIKRAHGIRGEIVVEVMTDAPDAIFASGRSVWAGNTHGDVDQKSSELHITAARPFGDDLLVFADELTDRTSAELWRGRYLLVSESEIEEPEGDEVFLHEFPGMKVVSEDGEVQGDVSGTFDMPQGLMLEIQRPNGKTALLPFRYEMVVAVDRVARVITVSVPEGLFDAQ